MRNVVKIFGSKRNLGKQVGETAAIVFREAVIVGGARVALTKVKEIFIDQNGNVKDQELLFTRSDGEEGFLPVAMNRFVSFFSNSISEGFPGGETKESRTH